MCRSIKVFHYTQPSLLPSLPLNLAYATGLFFPNLVAYERYLVHLSSSVKPKEDPTFVRPLDDVEELVESFSFNVDEETL
jgi:hypothetical protein